MAPLAILAMTAILLVGGIVFAAAEADTTASITHAGQLIVGALALGVFTLAAFFVSLGKPHDVVATSDRGGLTIGKKKIRSASIRHAYVIRDGDRWSVEIERLFGATRLLTDDLEAAERLVGGLAGIERAPAALHRLRKKAQYLQFSGTCFAWVMVFAGIVAIAFNAVAGVVMVVAALPFAAWVTIKTVPTVVIVERSGVYLLHPLANRAILADRIVSARVVNDDAVRIDLPEGSMHLGELANHPRDREARTSAPPAERFEASLQQIAAQAHAV